MTLKCTYVSCVNFLFVFNYKVIIKWIRQYCIRICSFKSVGSESLILTHTKQFFKLYLKLWNEIESVGILLVISALHTPTIRLCILMPAPFWYLICVNWHLFGAILHQDSKFYPEMVNLGRIWWTTFAPMHKTNHINNARLAPFKCK